MKQSPNSCSAALIVAFGIAFIALGTLAAPRASYADEGTGPACNEGGDPSMPKGCFGWCYSPKICQAHPIKLVCKCR